MANSQQEVKKEELFKFLEKKIIFQISRIFFLLLILLYILSCSKNAEVKGIVRDAATGKGIEGVEVRALSDKLGKKIVVKTSKDGNYKLSLPPSEWDIHFNPKDSPIWKKEYFSAFLTFTVYEKEKKYDTVWLLPCPPDSLPEVGYLVDKGRGLYRLEVPRPDYDIFFGKFFGRPPTFSKVRKPYALLFYDPEETKHKIIRLYLAHLSTTTPWELGYGGHQQLWYIRNEKEITGTTVMKEGNWYIVPFPSPLKPAKYALYIVKDIFWGLSSPYIVFLFEIVEELEESSQKGTDDTKKITKEAKDPVTLLKSEYPDAEITIWKEWAIVREPVTETGDMPAQILKWEDNQWKIIASTTDGFWYIEDVKEYIPNLSKEGAKKLRLTHK